MKLYMYYRRQPVCRIHPSNSSHQRYHNTMTCVGSWNVSLRQLVYNTHVLHYIDHQRSGGDWYIISVVSVCQTITSESPDVGTVASLGWVSPGAATDGVTSIFPEKKLTTFFRHRRLPVLRCHPYLFSPKKLTTFCAHHCHFIDISLRCHHPWRVSPAPLGGCHPHPFYLSDLVYPSCSMNLPTHFFPSGVTPWRMLPGAVRPPL